MPKNVRLCFVCVSQATISQIEHFGQTPTQLLVDPHKERYKSDDVISSLFSTNRLRDIRLYFFQVVTHAADGSSQHNREKKQSSRSGRSEERFNPLMYISLVNDKMVTLSLDRVMRVHKWHSTPEYVPPFSFLMESDKVHPKHVGVHYGVDMKIQPFLFKVTLVMHSCSAPFLFCFLSFKRTFPILELVLGLNFHPPP